MQKKRSKKARENTVAIFGSNEDSQAAGDFYHFKKAMPKSKTEFSRITAKLCDEIKERGEPTSVASVALNVARSIYEISQRKNIDSLDMVVCDHCGEPHEVNCTECGKSHPINIVDSGKERNTLEALKYLGNKWFPNKAPVTNEFNQGVFIDEITSFVSKVIAQLPAELQRNYTEEWVKVITKLEDENA